MYHFYIYETAFGPFFYAENGRAITHIGRAEHAFSGDCVRKETPLLRKAHEEMTEYLVGERTVFDLPLEPEGTAFQKKVWDALQSIPYGETRTYEDIAVKIGNPKACRAVGLANNRNPIWIVIPCHRVIGKNGSLTGYGGGLEMKAALLALEREHIKRGAPR